MSETCSSVLRVPTDDPNNSVYFECQEAPGFNAVDDAGEEIHLHRHTAEDTSQHVWQD